jgi:3D (Asp-Asp-Asp) domain-containing protein
MQFSRGLTSPERWDLGLMLALLIVASLCGAVCWNYRSIPTMFAQPRTSETTTPTSVKAASPAALPPLIQIPVTSMPAATVPAPVAMVPAVLRSMLPAVAAAPKPTVSYRWFNGEKYRYWKTVRMHVTAYAPDRRCCWPFDGTTTASGLSVKTNHGKLVAADTNLIPMHAVVSVPGYHGGETVPVLDRGGAIKGRRLDVLMPTFDQAKEWGGKDIEVKVYLPVTN